MTERWIRVSNGYMDQPRHAKVERVTEDDFIRLIVRGRLDRDSASAVLDWLSAWTPKKGGKIGLDLVGVEAMDSAGVAAVARWLDLALEKKCHPRLLGASKPARRILEMFRFQDDKSDDDLSRHEPFFESLGDWAIGKWTDTKEFFLLLSDILYWSVVGPFVSGRGAPSGELTRQTILLGSMAFGIVGLLAALIGLTMALLSMHQLRQFGANIYVADLVAVAMVREMGPMMTAIIVAGRSGSAIAAELATMEVTEEVDALRAMGFSPVRFLVVPKVYAVTITQPLLTAASICFGILGGMAIATVALGVPPEAYLNRTGEVLKFKDLVTGLSKSLVFGWIILVVAAHSGLGTRGGAGEVGISTTRSVVLAIFSVIIADCIFSLIFYL